MPLVSTRDRAPSASVCEAVRRGIAPDGGLYVPEGIAPLPKALREEVHTGPLAVTAARVIAHLTGRAHDTLDELCRRALDIPCPLKRLDDRISVLELFHGPSLAFKDFGARLLAELLELCAAKDGGEVTVLAATSGDTGGAVAAAFHGRPGIRISILFPKGKISPHQEKQFTTWGDNVTALAVEGDFDDCQRLAREALQDSVLLTSLPLTSANSTNIGRLLPQILYYFQITPQAERAESQEIIVSVPCGNLGNLTGGLMARRLGARVDHFVAATNANRALLDFLNSGNVVGRPAIRTISNAMDVARPNNLERIEWLYRDDPTALARDVIGISVSDELTREAIRWTHQNFDYVADPHTAVGIAALRQELQRHPAAHGVVLATAHPAKFPEVVEPEIGEPVAIPDCLARRLDAPSQCQTISADLNDLRDSLLA